MKMRLLRLSSHGFLGGVGLASHLGLTRHRLLACERWRCVFFGLTSHCVCERFVLGGVKMAYEPRCLERHGGGLRAVKTAYEP